MRHGQPRDAGEACLEKVSPTVTDETFARPRIEMRERVMMVVRHF
jgi:hypothetical protein